MKSVHALLIQVSLVCSVPLITKHEPTAKCSRSICEGFRWTLWLAWANRMCSPFLQAMWQFVSQTFKTRDGLPLRTRLLEATFIVCMISALVGQWMDTESTGEPALAMKGNHPISRNKRALLNLMVMRSLPLTCRVTAYANLWTQADCGKITSSKDSSWTDLCTLA